MRKQIWIPCVVVLAICLLLILKVTQHKPSEALTNQVGQSPQPKIVENTQTAGVPSQPETTSIPKPPPALVAEAKSLSTPEGSNAFQQRVLANWQRPIDFYGIVMDENTNPVAGANVTFKLAETPSEDGNRTANTKSDAEGLFSLHGEHGPSLEIWVSKEGYYASHKGRMGVSYLHGDFSPDPQNPVIFYLRKKGVGENLIEVKQNYRVARDGTPLGIDLTTGKSTTGGSGDLVVECWTDDQGKPSGAKYAWHCVVTIPGGGLVLSDEEFPFLAPESGYALTNQISMPADRPDWTSDVDLKFFYRLADGRYGRMTFSMIAGGQHFCMIDSVLNPSGSRNLEPP